jgi:hypothetical protein
MIRARLYTKECIIQAVIENRIAEAANTKFQQYDPTALELADAGHKTELWREPEDKSLQGRRGPAETLRLYRDQGKAIILWKGFPMLVPTRHIRPHIGFTWLLDDPTRDLFQVGDSKLVHSIMELVEESVVGQILIYGKLWDTVHVRYYLVPPDLLTRSPVVYHESVQLAAILDFQSFEGVQFSTDCKFTDPLQGTTRGKHIAYYVEQEP